jgi:ACT domain-containing protein
MLADSIQHNSTITEACRYVGVSRQTYYAHLKNEVFAEKMATAKKNQSKLIFSFVTIT